jgi:hypothetical protein
MGSFMIFPLLSRKCEYSKPNNKNISFQTSLKTNSLYFQKKKNQFVVYIMETKTRIGGDHDKDTAFLY